MSEYDEEEIASERIGLAQSESEKWKIIDKHLNSDGKGGSLLHRNTVMSRDDVEIHAIGYTIDAMLNRTIRGKSINTHFAREYLLMRERLLISTNDGRGRQDIVKIMQPAMLEEEKERRSVLDAILGPKRSSEK